METSSACAVWWARALKKTMFLLDPCLRNHSGKMWHLPILSSQWCSHRLFSSLTQPSPWPIYMSQRISSLIRTLSRKFSSAPSLAIQSYWLQAMKSGRKNAKFYHPPSTKTSWYAWQTQSKRLSLKRLKNLTATTFKLGSQWTSWKKWETCTWELFLSLLLDSPT